MRMFLRNVKWEDGGVDRGESRTPVVMLALSLMLALVICPCPLAYATSPVPSAGTQAGSGLTEVTVVRKEETRPSDDNVTNTYDIGRAGSNRNNARADLMQTGIVNHLMISIGLLSISVFLFFVVYRRYDAEEKGDDDDARGMALNQ